MSKVEITAIAVRESSNGSIDFTVQKNGRGTILSVPNQHTFKGKEYFSVATKPSIAAKGTGNYCQNAADMIAILWKTGMVHAVMVNGTIIDCSTATQDMATIINSQNLKSFEIVKLVGREVVLQADEKGRVTAQVIETAQPVAPAAPAAAIF